MFRVGVGCFSAPVSYVVYQIPPFRPCCNPTGMLSRAGALVCCQGGTHVSHPHVLTDAAQRAGGTAGRAAQTPAAFSLRPESLSTPLDMQTVFRATNHGARPFIPGSTPYSTMALALHCPAMPGAACGSACAAQPSAAAPVPFAPSPLRPLMRSSSLICARQLVRKPPKRRTSPSAAAASSSSAVYLRRAPRHIIALLFTRARGQAAEAADVSLAPCLSRRKRHAHARLHFPCEASSTTGSQALTRCSTCSARGCASMRTRLHSQELPSSAQAAGAYSGRSASGGRCVLAGAPRICCALVCGP